MLQNIKSYYLIKLIYTFVEESQKLKLLPLTCKIKIN